MTGKSAFPRAAICLRVLEPQKKEGRTRSRRHRSVFNRRKSLILQIGASPNTLRLH
jgi:hypothetical protein